MPTAYHAHRTRADRASVAPPVRVPFADWQAGVTEGNERLKVLLDGRPVVGCFAASVKEGWVLLLPEPQFTDRLRPDRSAPLGAGYRIDPLRDHRRLTGRVRVVPADDD